MPAPPSENRFARKASPLGQPQPQGQNPLPKYRSKFCPPGSEPWDGIGKVPSDDRFVLKVSTLGQPQPKDNPHSQRIEVDFVHRGASLLPCHDQVAYCLKLMDCLDKFRERPFTISLYRHRLHLIAHLVHLFSTMRYKPKMTLILIH